MKKLNSEKGVAIILALLFLLVLSTLATTLAFVSNMDFQAMSNYKGGQEAFLAAERCAQESRKVLETIGVEVLFFNIQGGQSSGIDLVLNNGSYCRTGNRYWRNPNPSGSLGSAMPPFAKLPPPSKVTGRPLKHVSLPSGGVGGAVLVPTEFTVTGKDHSDEDMNDVKNDINTGVEVSIGLESFIPGGASNVY